MLQTGSREASLSPDCPTTAFGGMIDWLLKPTVNHQKDSGKAQREGKKQKPKAT